MARLEAKEKLLYYPTPELVTAIIATHFNAVGQVRLVDPCCGDGTALRDFADSLDGGGEIETWGIELSQTRAADAEVILDRVLPTNFYTATWDRNSCGLIFNNPPYDWSSRVDQNGKKIRHEHLFVSEATPRLVTGGHQVIIVPRSMFAYEPFARHLMGWYEEIHLFRFPDGEYEHFKQAVLFALLKRKKYQVPPKDSVASLVEIGNTTEEECGLKVLPTGSGQYIIPPSLSSARFSYTPITAEDMVALAEKASGIGSPQWLHATHLRGLGEPISPLVPLKLGHLTMTISSGDMGTVRVDRKDGHTMLVKGVNRKGVKSSSTAATTDDGDTVHHHEEQEVFETHITALKDNGDVLTLSKPQTVADFITEQAEYLGNAIMERNCPEYNFDPTDEEWSKVSRVALGLPPLPGRSERGLFKVQKHFAVAAARGMRKRKHIILNAEMGFGKAGSLDSKILTPTGWTTMGQIQVGDEVIGANGLPTKVVGVYPQGEKDIYRVTFTDGSSTECCDEHLWLVNSPLRKWRGRKGKVLPLCEIRKNLSHANGNLQHFIPMVKPVEFEEHPLPLDPYLLGALLGDGGISGRNVCFSTADKPLLEQVRLKLPDGMSIKKKTGGQYDYQIVSNDGKHNRVLDTLRQLDLQGHCAEGKFIPEIYKFSSSTSRIALLQGLMDTDGSICNETALEFSSVSKQLAEGVVFLAQSLGGTASLAKRQTFFTYNGKR